MLFLKRNQKRNQKKKPKESVLTIRENVTSMWFYHFALDGKPICGTSDLTMPTNVPVDAWGWVSDHIHERYCPECTKRYNKMNIG